MLCGSTEDRLNANTTFSLGAEYTGDRNVLLNLLKGLQIPPPEENPCGKAAGKNGNCQSPTRPPSAFIFSPVKLKEYFAINFRGLCE